MSEDPGRRYQEEVYSPGSGPICNPLQPIKFYLKLRGKCRFILCCCSQSVTNMSSVQEKASARAIIQDFMFRVGFTYHSKKIKRFYSP